MKKISLIFSLIALFSVSAFAQKADDSKDALAVVNKLFAEMAAHNPAGIVALFSAPDGQLGAAIKNKEGKSVIRSFPAEAFSKNFAEKRGELKEDMYAPKVELFGDLALVYGRYVFFIDGKISHCGVNSFHLARGADGAWKIANAATTIEPQGCTEQEKAMKAPVAPAAPTKP